MTFRAPPCIYIYIHTYSQSDKEVLSQAERMEELLLDRQKWQSIIGNLPSRNLKVMLLIRNILNGRKLGFYKERMGLYFGCIINLSPVFFWPVNFRTKFWELQCSATNVIPFYHPIKTVTSQYRCCKRASECCSSWKMRQMSAVCKMADDVTQLRAHIVKTCFENL